MLHNMRIPESGAETLSATAWH